MGFLLDENVDIRLKAHLLSLGHDVTAIAEDYPRCLEDLDVLALAHREQRIVITNDRDFGELAVQTRKEHAGVINFRLRSTRLSLKI